MNANLFAQISIPYMNMIENFIENTNIIVRQVFINLFSSSCL